MAKFTWNDLEGYITKKEYCRKGFEMIGSFDGYNVYRKCSNNSENTTDKQN